MPVTSPYIWYPSGATGPAYDLRKVYSWYEPSPADGQIVVRFYDSHNGSVTVRFNKSAFETALQVALDSGSSPGGGPNPGNTVVVEQSFGLSPAIGTSLAYSRADHSHGTPADAPSDGNLYGRKNGNWEVAGTGGEIAVYDEGVLLTSAASALNFVGPGVTATDEGGGVVQVTINATGSGGNAYFPAGW
jgi:hypothetical protein